ncbi:MAG: glycosyltransferase [Moraxella sp.]|uniref:glycosyltransferase n=1 Tax=Moraxella sp. TaxID=479 RepID=UPI0026DC1E7E|nr:glycosyltransferase [Moraxella sp.]MDO4449570.1 glycosyltransferase [Moraxella sp.]
MIKLSVIIPFRCESESSDYLMYRLKELLKSIPKDLPLEFMVVDSGSSLDYRTKCQKICQTHGVIYIYHDTFGSPFSIGACRDFGVKHAKGCAVSFLDVDLRVAPDFWQRLLVLMEAWGISKYKKSFLAIPCMYHA